MNGHKKWFALIGLLTAVLIWLAFFWDPRPPEAPLTSIHSASSAQPNVAGGDFTLQGADGPVSLAHYRGKIVLLYFGYTYCPDVCPTSLAAMAQALSALKPDEVKRVNGLLITVDPERDTPDILKIYAPYFHPRIAGLSGSPSQIAEVARQYGVRYMKQKPNADGLYSVDHSSVIYVLAADGRLAAQLPHGTAPQQIVDAVRALLKP